MAGIPVKPDSLQDLIKDPEWAGKVKSARAAGHSYEDIQARLIEKGVMNKPGTIANVQQTGFAEGPRKMAATAVRVGLPVVLGLMKPRLITAGTVAAEAIAEKIEGQNINPKQLAVASVSARLAPGVEGTIPGGILKGATFGLFTTTAQSIVEKGEMPPAGEAAMGAATGALLTGTGRYMLRPSLYNLSRKDVAEEVTHILTKPSGSIVPSTMAEREAISDVNKVSGQLPGKYTFVEREAAPNFYKARGYRILEEGEKKTKWRPVDFFDREPIEEPVAEQGQLALKRQLEPLPNRGADVPDIVPRNTLGVPKAWFDRAQRETKIPLYDEVYAPVQRANNKSVEFIHGKSADLRQAFDIVKHAKREAYQAYLESPNPQEMESRLQLKVGDTMRAHKVKDVWDRMFKEFGLGDNSDEYLTQVLPKLRAASYELDPGKSGKIPIEKIIDHAYPVGKPPALEFFQDMYKNEQAGFHDTDSLGIVSRHLQYGSYKTFVADSVQQAHAKYVQSQLPQGIRDTVSGYLKAIEGAGDPTGHDLALWMSLAAKKLGVKIDPKDNKAFVNMLISSSYGGALGLRPGPIIRNSLQTLQTGYADLGRYWFVGAKMALSRKGMEQAQGLGLLEGDQGMRGELSSLLIKGRGSKMQRFANLTTRGVSGTLATYQSVDERNRAIMGLGQWARAQRAIRLAKGDVDKFLDYAWIDSGSFFPAEREEIKGLFIAGNHNEAARRSAVAMADNTQWMYTAGNRPPVLTGTAGRAIGGFATWSDYYVNYLKRLATTSPGETGKKQAIRLARWFAVNAALTGTGVAIGKSLGIEDSVSRVVQQNFFGPAVYIPGKSPVGQEITEAASTAQELAGGTVGGAHMKALGRNTTTFIPGSGAVKDFLHLMKPDKGMGEAVGRTSGVLPRSFR
jgi:hypothetical protein